jgi:hypothetical protein
MMKPDEGNECRGHNYYGFGGLLSSLKSGLCACPVVGDTYRPRLEKGEKGTEPQTRACCGSYRHHQQPEHGTKVDIPSEGIGDKKKRELSSTVHFLPQRGVQVEVKNELGILGYCVLQNDLSLSEPGQASKLQP